jgi:hypothetical protein
MDCPNCAKIAEDTRRINMDPRLSLQPETVRQAFEVEDIYRRTNFTFVYEPTTKQVDLFETSRGVGKRLDMSYREQGGFLMPIGGPSGAVTNPLGCTNAYKYFVTLYGKSINTFTGGIVFLGWVDPDTIQPIAEMDGVDLGEDADLCRMCGGVHDPESGVCTDE